MIVYFASRDMNIIGQASTSLPDGFTIIEDLKTEDIETGVAVFECTIPFEAETRAKVEECTEVGNYILRSHNGENEFYTIVEAEIDTKNQRVEIYAEDAGLDLLNEICGAYEADKAYPIRHYIEKFAYDSGFEIGVNEVSGLTRKLKWDGESTVTERLASVATQFDGCEVSYSFAIKGLHITHKYINIYKERGNDVGVQLRLNEEVDRIITKKSILNLGTAILATGGTPEDAELPINLSGYTYDDGDIYLDGKYLKSRSAVAKWSRYLNPNEPHTNYTGHILRMYTYDTTSQSELCTRAVAELKRISDLEINYEVEINNLPDNLRLGDRVNIVDDGGGLYVSARVLQLETSVVDQKQQATIGEYLIKGSGISQRVADLASQFAQSAQAAASAWAAAQAAKAEAEAAKEQATNAEQTAQDAQDAADTVQVELENLQIGGRNYIQQADVSKYSGDWIKWQNSVLSLEGEFLKIAPTAGDTTIGAHPPKISTLENGVEYTLSFEAYADADLALNYNYIMCADGNFSFGNAIAITTTPAKYAYTFTTTKAFNGCAVMLGHRNNNGITSAFYVKNLMVEKGNHATDWTPAMEDMATTEDADNAAKTATNFLYHDTTNGLQVGNRSSGAWSGYRTQIKSDSFNVLDASGNVASSFGANQIELGKNNNSAVVKMCNGNLTIRNRTSAEYYAGTLSSIESGWINIAAQGVRSESYRDGVMDDSGNDCKIGDVLQVGCVYDYGGTKIESYKWNNDVGVYDGMSTFIVSPFAITLDTGSFNTDGIIIINSPTVSINGGVGIHGTLETTGNAKIGGSATVGGKKVLTAADVQSGTWTPKCAAISSPTQAVGQYTKIGDTCTISFCIYGTSSSSSTNSQSLRITGLPFTPDTSVKWFAGGGNISGAQTGANYSFSGYCIENNSTYGPIILPRAVAVTSSAATRTSNYCTNVSGSTIYMSGTIMYKVAT